jgi:RNA polymerase sigma-70 factor (ECF subfamily)
MLNTVPTFDLAEDPAPYVPEQLYREHGAWLIAFLRRRFGREAAEDLAQETYLRLARHAAEIRNPRAFLARVALNAARDQARRRAARPVLLPEDSAREAGAGSAQHQALLLKETILALPPKLREVFVLSRFGGLTYEEIARRCGIAPKTVEKRMTQALRMCATLLDPT